LQISKWTKHGIIHETQHALLVGNLSGRLLDAVAAVTLFLAVVVLFASGDQGLVFQVLQISISSHGCKSTGSV